MTETPGTSSPVATSGRALKRNLSVWEAIGVSVNSYDRALRQAAQSGQPCALGSALEWSSLSEDSPELGHSLMCQRRLTLTTISGLFPVMSVTVNVVNGAKGQFQP